MDMQQAIAFINDFIETEYRAYIAQWTERDDQVYEQHYDTLRKFYGAYLSPEVNRPPSVDERWFKRAEKQGYVAAI